MSDLKGMAYLRRRLLQKRVRVQTRYKYYEMKNAVKDFGMVTPPEFRSFTEVLAGAARLWTRWPTVWSGGNSGRITST